MIAQSDIEPVYAALTLASRRPDQRGKWIRRGFGKMRPRLVAYWERRLSAGNPTDLAMFETIRRGYFEAKSAPKTIKHGIPGSVPQTPSIVTMAKTATASLATWAKQGFKTTTPEELESRLSVCRSCPQWDGNAFGGSGRCRTCGCSTAAKLRLAHEKCPEGRWGPVT